MRLSRNLPPTNVVRCTYLIKLSAEKRFPAAFARSLTHSPHGDDPVGRPAEDEDAHHHHRHLERARAGAVQHARPRPPQLAGVGRRRRRGAVRRRVAVL